MKKLFTLLLALAVSVGTLFAESGKCGANLSWDLTNGVLTISGSGDMTDWDPNGGSYAPWYGKNITSVIIGNSVTSIGDNAFGASFGLTSVTIGNSVTSIGEMAFWFCTGLTSVIIGNSVTNIGDNAFELCSGLTNIEIPNSVTGIGRNAFVRCSSLKSITCHAVVPPVCGTNTFYEVDKSIPVYVPGNSVEAYKAADGWKEFTNIQGRTFEAIENISAKIDGTRKLIHDGQVLILRGDKSYTVTGQEVK